jgi:tetratricopeptide (TPR) repeat protein
VSRTLSLALTLALGLCTRLVRSDPSIWQRAEQPELGHGQVLLSRVERMLGTVGLPEFNAEFSAGAVALFQLSEGRLGCVERTPGSEGDEPTLDPRLEYLLGGALLEAEANRDLDARCILERALRDAPDSPLAAQGYFNLALVAGKLLDRKLERAAYRNALQITWEPEIRANVYGNLAESEMGAGDLSGALRDYRVALSIALEPETLSLSYFGLAVALDRSGDLPSALDAAKRAISVQLPMALSRTDSVLDLPSVSFSPSYEIYYYKALGAMAAAALTTDFELERNALVDAREQWSRYLEPAALGHAAWIQRAELHRARVERELAKLPALRTNRQKDPLADPGDL